jgi:hypothetical protein
MNGGLSSWGTYCKCPDGNTYAVAAKVNDCETFACDNGDTDGCFKYANSAWTGKGVNCADKDKRSLARWLIPLFILFWVIPWFYMLIYACTCGKGDGFKQKFFPKAESCEYYSIYCCPASALIRSWCCWEKPEEKSDAAAQNRKNQPKDLNLNPNSNFYAIAQVYIPPEGLAMKQIKAKENLGETRPEVNTSGTGTENIDIPVPHPKIMAVNGGETVGRSYPNPQNGKAKVSPLPNNHEYDNNQYNHLNDSSNVQSTPDSPREEKHHQKFTSGSED